MSRLTYLRTAVALLVLGFTTVPTHIRRFEVAERSMSPTLNPGDYLASASAARFDIGDIVIYSSTVDSSFFLVKRVIALGGSKVTLNQGVLTVDGSVRHEPYATGQGRQGGWEVGPDQVFVLGDDRSVSIGDSATLGPLAVAAIDSVVRFRYWPPAKIGPV